MQTDFLGGRYCTDRNRFLDSDRTGHSKRDTLVVLQISCTFKPTELSAGCRDTRASSTEGCLVLLASRVEVLKTAGAGDSSDIGEHKAVVAKIPVYDLRL